MVVNNFIEVPDSSSAYIQRNTGFNSHILNGGVFGVVKSQVLFEDCFSFGEFEVFAEAVIVFWIVQTIAARIE